MDWKIESVAIPVSNVDRAKAFYAQKVGFNADHAHWVSDTLRFVQPTPPGSACSISIGEGISDAARGSVRGMRRVVTDVNAARSDLVGRGVDVGEVQEFPGACSSTSPIPTATNWQSKRFRTEIESSRVDDETSADRRCDSGRRTPICPAIALA